jgi:hypothetical protein
VGWIEFETQFGKEYGRPNPQEKNMRAVVFGLYAGAIAGLLYGCEGQRPAETKSVPASNAATKPAEQWLGQWNGPEGTYLVLSKNGEKYTVKINSLDGSATYEGVAAGDHIEFKRDGKTETIRAGTDTGMKWLMDKTNCLIIKTGEGFCR